jgi:hypothetical protein
MNDQDKEEGEENEMGYEKRRIEGNGDEGR